MTKTEAKNKILELGRIIINSKDLQESEIAYNTLSDFLKTIPFSDKKVELANATIKTFLIDLATYPTVYTLPSLQKNQYNHLSFALSGLAGLPEASLLND